MSFGLPQGAIFAGRYQVLSCIAAGGMGAVYEVIHLETERRRALKVMLPHVIQSADLCERFKREAKVAAKIESEFIVDVFDAGVDEATQMPFLVMELLRGEDLGKRLKRHGRFSAIEVVTYLQQTAMALDKTHQASIVHRDLKPDNLFLTFRDDGQPRIKVLDFGVAKVIAESSTAAGATRSLGTPLYMSPEQFNSEARLTAAADIYALGMIAYTLLVGTTYWDIESRSSNVVAFAMRAVQGPPDPASMRAARHDVALPPAFDMWFAQISAREPSYRFPSATSAVAALAAALGLPSPRTSFSLEQGGSAPNEPSQVGLRLAPAVMSEGVTPFGARTPAGPPAPVSWREPVSAPVPMSAPSPVSSPMNVGAQAPVGLVAPVGSTMPLGGLTPSGAAMSGKLPVRGRGAALAAGLLAAGVVVLAGGAFVVMRSLRVKAEAPVSGTASAVAPAAAALARVASAASSATAAPGVSSEPRSLEAIAPAAPLDRAGEVKAPSDKPRSLPWGTSSPASTRPRSSSSTSPGGALPPEVF